MNFCHLVDLFKKRELHFSHPSVWEDKYETRLTHDDLGRVFGQCWSNHYSSDAMWRIYSQSFMGVRISTTPRQFREAVDQANEKGANLRFRLQDVRYLPLEGVTMAVRRVREKIDNGEELCDVTDALFYKRNFFDHEAECRALLITEESNPDAVRTGIKLPINPHIFINRILLDPRTPDQLADAFINYIQKKLNYKGEIGISSLHRVPKPL